MDCGGCEGDTVRSLDVDGSDEGEQNDMAETMAGTQEIHEP